MHQRIDREHGADRTQSHRAQDGPARLEVIGIEGLPEVRSGDDLTALLAAHLHGTLQDGDVLCISTKIISKAAGLVVPPEQKDAAVREQAVRTVARRRHGTVVTSIVQVAHGPVMAAAGIDSSNAPDGLLLLPEDPDACARQIRSALQDATGCALAVILTDTSSRIWRQGVGDIALGAAGLASLQDLRGTADAQGRRMAVTVRNLADELAAAADLVKGKTAGIPAAIIRGAEHALAEPGIPASALSRTGPDDWFRRPSLESVWQALGLHLEDEPVAAMDPEPAPARVERAIQVALKKRHGAEQIGNLYLEHVHCSRDHDGEHISDVERGSDVDPEPLLRRDGMELCVVPGSDTPRGWARAGALVERLRTALAAEAIADDDPALRAIRIHLEAPCPRKHPEENAR